MVVGKGILSALLAFALSLYAFECVGVTTREQAMRCCKMMPCHSHGHHGQECCKAMTAMHPVIGQPSSMAAVSCAPLVLGIADSFVVPSVSGLWGHLIFEDCHAPPVSHPAYIPLRI